MQMIQSKLMSEESNCGRRSQGLNTEVALCEMLVQRKKVIERRDTTGVGTFLRKVTDLEVAHISHPGLMEI